MPHFEVLGSLVKDLHQEFVRMFYLILPVFYMIAIALGWFRTRSEFNFIDPLKRAIIATLLLVSFQDISTAIVSVADAIATRIDDMSGLDAVMKMADQKIQGYSISPTAALLSFPDLLVSILTFLSYLILYVARYLTIVMYYFFWIFLSVSSPLLLLFNVFPGTSQITANLFRGLIEVASWKICWAILSAMLTALSFGDIYKTEGNYLTVVVLNFVIALAMIMTPMIVKSLVGSGVQSMSSSLGAGAVAAMVAVPAKAGVVASKASAGMSVPINFAKNKIVQRREEKQRRDSWNKM